MAVRVLVERRRICWYPEIFEVKEGSPTVIGVERKTSPSFQLSVVAASAADIADQRIALGVRPDGRSSLTMFVFAMVEVLPETAL